MTYATDKGLVVGKQYRTVDDDNGVPAGTIVTLEDDDGTDCVRFIVPKAYDSDGWTYLELTSIGAEVGVQSVKALSIDVDGDATTITIGRALTTKEIKLVLDIIAKE